MSLLIRFDFLSEHCLFEFLMQTLFDCLHEKFHQRFQFAVYQGLVPCRDSGTQIAASRFEPLIEGAFSGPAVVKVRCLPESVFNSGAFLFEFILHQKNGAGHLPDYRIVTVADQKAFDTAFFMGTHDD